MSVVEELVSLSKYAYTIHTGGSGYNHSYRMVDRNSKKIIMRDVGGRRKSKPVIHSDDGSLTYLDITEKGSVEMWVNQCWTDTMDSDEIRQARNKIKKRCTYLAKYKPSDDVPLVSQNVCVTVPYRCVMAYLAQHPMFKVSASRPIVVSDEEYEEEEDEEQEE